MIFHGQTTRTQNSSRYLRVVNDCCGVNCELLTPSLFVEKRVLNANKGKGNVNFEYQTEYTPGIEVTRKAAEFT